MKQILLVTLFAACQVDAPVPPPAKVDLAVQLNQAGPYAVGFRSDTISYQVPFVEENREVRVSIWYPADSGSGDETKYQGVFNAPDVWENADALPGPYPVLLYSHGHQGYAEASGMLMAHFASHGWLVAAPDHTNNTTWDGPDRTTEIFYERPLDISRIIDHLEELSTGDPLSQANTEEVILMGHSFGGYTTFALGGASYAMDDLAPACAQGDGPSAFCATMTPEKEALFRDGFRDDRVIGIIPMAPGDYDLFGSEGYLSLDAAAMHLTGELDPATGTSSDNIWAALPSPPHRRVHILGGGHQTFTDLSGILEQFDGLISAEDGNRILRIYTLAFAEYLLGADDRQPILDGVETISDAVVLSP
jgi:predicted dienelactone hydrolase